MDEKSSVLLLDYEPPSCLSGYAEFHELLLARDTPHPFKPVCRFGGRGRASPVASSSDAVERGRNRTSPPSGQLGYSQPWRPRHCSRSVAIALLVLSSCDSRARNVEGRLWGSQGGLRSIQRCDDALGLHLRGVLVQKLAARRLEVRKSGVASSSSGPAAGTAAVVGTGGIGGPAKPCCFPPGAPASFGRGMLPDGHVACVSSESFHRFRRVGLVKDSCFLSFLP